MYLDRHDFRGIVKFLAVMSFCVAIAFVGMNLGGPARMTKSRVTGHVGWAPASEMDIRSMRFALIPFAIGVVLTAVVKTKLKRD
jgi:hypothetical protein